MLALVTQSRQGSNNFSLRFRILLHHWNLLDQCRRRQKAPHKSMPAAVQYFAWSEAVVRLASRSRPVWMQPAKISSISTSKQSALVFSSRCARKRPFVSRPQSNTTLDGVVRRFLFWIYPRDISMCTSSPSPFLDFSQMSTPLSHTGKITRKLVIETKNNWIEKGHTATAHSINRNSTLGSSLTFLHYLFIMIYEMTGNTNCQYSVEKW